MSDQQLLERAARAAGIGPILCYESSRNCLRIGDRKQYRLWRPLDDDGDALRLAVQLDLLIYSYSAEQKCVAKWFAEGFAVEYWHWNQSQGQSAAMRRAIVRAAAEIGKATP